MGRMAWPKLLPKLLLLWVGEVTVDLFLIYVQSAYFRRTWNPTPPTTLSVAEEIARAQVKEEVFLGDLETSGALPSHLLNVPSP